MKVRAKNSKTKSSKFIVQRSMLSIPYAFRVFCIVLCHFILTSYFLLFTSYCSVSNAEIKDRVVAYVDNNAITLSELEEHFATSVQIKPDITREEVLQTMVNRLLLLREAKKIKLEAPSEKALLQEYIDLKIRAFIRINEAEVVDFYENHIDDFKGKELEDVREEIENVLTEKELNERLKSHIKELKDKACVKIQL